MPPIPQPNDTKDKVGTAPDTNLVGLVFWTEESITESWTEDSEGKGYRDEEPYEIYDYYVEPEEDIVTEANNENSSDLMDYAEKEAFEFVHDTSLFLIAIIGCLIFGIFIFGLCLGRRAMRNPSLPTRMRNVWQSVRVLEFRPAVIFRKGSGARSSFEGNTSKYSGVSPIFTHIPKANSETRDSEVSVSSEEGDPGPHNERRYSFHSGNHRYRGSGLGAFPQQTSPQGGDDGAKNKCEELVYSKVVTI